MLNTRKRIHGRVQPYLLCEVVHWKHDRCIGRPVQETQFGLILDCTTDPTL